MEGRPSGKVILLSDNSSFGEDQFETSKSSGECIGDSYGELLTTASRCPFNFLECSDDDTHMRRGKGAINAIADLNELLSYLHRKLKLAALTSLAAGGSRFAMQLLARPAYLSAC